MGFFDNPFGGLFDFNKDGKEDLGEQWIAYKIFEEATKSTESDDEDYGWRRFCEDGFEFGIDPEDYETEEEYNEALEEAKYGWRNTVEDGLEFGIDPEDYETEEEYNDALYEAKDGWLDTVEDGLEFGVDPEDYETEEEYSEARQMRYDEQQKQEREEEKQRQLLQQQRDAERIEQQKKHEAEMLNDKTIYTYCGVKFPFSINTYSFRTDDSSLKIGDTVIVPLGEENKETQGIIVSIGQYSRIGAPYPPEKTKFILRKKPENDTKKYENS